MSDGMSITITEGGPYIVRGNVPLFEKRIVRRDGLYVWEDVREIPHGETYALCRCGKTRDAPPMANAVISMTISFGVRIFMA